MDYEVNDESFLCPLCGSEWNHVECVTMVTGNGGLAVFYNGSEDEDAGVFARPTRGKRVGRRHAIVLSGWCEGCAHEFEVIFRQHKGQTFTGSFDLGRTPHMMMDD